MLKRFAYLFLFLLSASFVFHVPTPPGQIGPYLDGVFPDVAPGKGSVWSLEEWIPEVTLPAPLRVQQFPDSDELIVLCKRGEIYRVDPVLATSQLILDIKDRTFKAGDGGSVGMALHPSFDLNGSSNNEVFIYYRTKPNPDEWKDEGYNRLSKFTWKDNQFDASSEEILIQQYDRSPWHNGGGMFFGEDGFLYLSFGDEGYDHQQVASTQRLDGGFFNGVIRIDVDNDPDKSHSIIRQPISLGNPLNGWEDSYSQGYGIPNDNPWLDNNGENLEEFIALGSRSPYSIHPDPSGQYLWLADVGSDKREEINVFNIGDNLQWPYMEGKHPSDVHQKPTNFIGQELPVYYEYERDQGTCVIGGGVYTKTLFPDLSQKYLFVDYTHNKMVALTHGGAVEDPTIEVLLNNIKSQPIELPEEPNLSGVHLLENGEIILTILGKDHNVFTKLLKLKRNTEVPDPPIQLSDIHAFSDLSTLEPRNGMIPYDVNAPLWSDRAIKSRWMAIPNDGTYSSANEQITFTKEDPWRFPEGTVFIKHFELPTDLSDPSISKHLETRFFIVGKGKKGYGLTYKWNEEGTDATLLNGGTSEEIDIIENGSIVYSQTWNYPGRDQCLSCHNDNAEYILGVKTHQLNGDYHYPSQNQKINQLEYLNDLNIFTSSIGVPSSYLRSYDIAAPDADLETRIQSYMDANCASCHQRGGISEVTLDLRYKSDISLKSYINFPSESHASVGLPIIRAGIHEESDIWQRDASTEDNQMPPIARNVVDQVYVDSLAVWIDNLEEPKEAHGDIILFPNPSRGWLGLSIPTDWIIPYEVNITSISGRPIRQFEVSSQFGFIDLTSYPKGTYLVLIASGEKKVQKRFILQ